MTQKTTRWMWLFDGARRVLIDQTQHEIGLHPEFQQDAMLVFDESAEAKQGDVSSGPVRPPESYPTRGRYFGAILAVCRRYPIHT